VRKFLLHEDYLEKNQSTTANLAASGDLRFLGEVVSSPDWPWPEGILPESWQFVDPSQPLTAEQVEEWGVPCSDCRAGLKLLSGSELTSQVAAGIGPGGKAE
jgi:hypothetical protein